LAAGRSGDALRIYREAEKLFPDEESLTSRLQAARKKRRDATEYQQRMWEAETALTLRNLPLALAKFEQALRLAPGDLEAAQGVMTTKAAILKEAKESYQRRLRQAETAMQQGDYSLALRRYEQAAVLFPNAPEAVRGVRSAKTAIADAIRKGADPKNWPRRDSGVRDSGPRDSGKKDSGKRDKGGRDADGKNNPRGGPRPGPEDPKNPKNPGGVRPDGTKKNP
jgi:tetratricopeptide (TPR) repeat protein